MKRIYTRFFPTLGRLPRTWPCLAIIVLSGLAEGVGIMLFVPLIAVMTGAEMGSALAGLPFADFFAPIAEAGGLLPLLGGILAFILGALSLAYLQGIMVARATHRYVRETRIRYIRTLFLSPLEAIVERSHGEAANQLSNEAYRGGYALQAELQSVAYMILAAIYMAFAGFLSWTLLVGALAFTGLAMLVVWPMQRRAADIGKRMRDSNHLLSVHALDFLQGARLIKSSANEIRALGALERYVSSVYDVWIGAERLRILSYFSLQALPAVLVATLIAASATVLDMPVPTLLTFIMFLARIAPRVAQFQQQRHAYMINAAAFRTVENMIAASSAHGETFLSDTARAPARFGKAIVLTGVDYLYATGKTALEGIDLTVPKNAMIALVGSSGAGKSTLADIIAGLRRPTAGRVTVDGEDLWTLDLAGWRRRAGYVTQDISVFSGTVRENLTFAHPDVTEADIAEAVKTANFAEVLAGLPDGLETVMGQDGVRLSGGQRQRLALARALLGRPELLILDEATSALDNESERLIQDAIERVAHRMTIVIIAHRLTTIQKADAIYVMEGGRIVERGTYDQLAAAGGRFAQLHALQATKIDSSCPSS